jgi:DNA-binding PadR family transcriptional regulator
MVRQLRPNKQEDVEDVILSVLEGGGALTTDEINRAVRKRITLAPADLERAAKRPNEAKIDQIIANALQDGRRLCRDGLIERVGRGEFRITGKGRDYLTDHRKLVNEMVLTLKEMFSDEDFED